MAFLESEAAKVALKLLAPIAGSAALVAAGFAAGEVYEHKVPWGLAHQLAHARSDLTASQAAARKAEELAKGWEASFRASEGQRVQDQASAVNAVNQAQAACDARVSQARRSGLAISDLVSKESPHDAYGCPVRQLLDPRELRDAVRGSGPAG